MPIPDRSRIKEALVELIRQHGKNDSVTPREAYKGLAARFNLTAEDLARERESENLWRNEVRWARQDLVDEGVLLPKEESGYATWKLNLRLNEKPFNESPQGTSYKSELGKIYDDLNDEGLFKPANASDARDIILRAIVQRRGQQSFRALLLREYEGTCAITGEKYPAILEAAHIIPYSGEETNHAQNGLLLRSDIHTLFDLHLIAIDPSLTVRISPSLRGTSYEPLDGIIIRLPLNQRNNPSKEALEKHQSQCDF